ncbi:MAG TPA: hypothetical protein VMV59_12005 [Candidatus Dormibacteraeota bacterium]|nr:hypothetical protein [Candidatus Dormibacteraeota bacterium]
MADSVGWPAEVIPDSDFVFMRAHRDHFPGGKLAPGLFRQRGGGMSVDWEKYSTPEETKNRAKQPADNAVVKLSAAGIRAIQPLRVEHTPDYPENRSHSDVFDMPTDESLVEVRVRLLRITDVVIPTTPTAR